MAGEILPPETETETETEPVTTVPDPEEVEEVAEENPVDGEQAEDDK